MNEKYAVKPRYLDQKHLKFSSNHVWFLRVYNCMPLPCWWPRLFAMTPALYSQAYFYYSQKQGGGTQRGGLVTPIKPAHSLQLVSTLT